MTSGTPCQRWKREGEVTISGGKELGHGPFSGCGLKSAPRALSSFPYLFFFLFWFYLKTLQMNPILIQTSFAKRVIQISLCCLSIGKDFVSKKNQTFGTQMHKMKIMNACA
jgi:hypothetical protein